MLARDFPPRSAVYGYFRAWIAGGVRAHVHDVPYRRSRELEGRDETPTAAIIDSQSVRTGAEAREMVGFDAGKRVKGCKRHLVTDTLGLMLRIDVHSAGVQDRDGAALVLDRIALRFPSIERLFADAGYQGPRVTAAAPRPVEIVKRTITWNRLWILCYALAVFAVLLVVPKRTPAGLQMRAVTQNRRMAEAMGIRSGRVDAKTSGLGAGVAGLAGVALSQIDNVSPNLGQAYIVDSFMVVVFGGVGNLWGALAGAFALGTANKFLEPYVGAVLGKVLVLVFIIVFIQRRPRGLFALRGRAVEA